MTPTNARLFSSLSHKRSSGSVSYNSDNQLAAYGPNPKRQKAQNVNTKFDRMIETMAIISSVQHSTSSDNGRQSASSDANRNTTNKSRQRSHDRLFSPPIPTNVGSELSFIKGAKGNSFLGDRHSCESNNSKDSLEPPRSGRSCGSLPSWLATTFMSLSRKHPLRLLLPPNLAEASALEANSIPKQIGPKVSAPAVPSTSDDIFAFKVPGSASNDRDASASSENTVFDQLLPPEIHINDKQPAYMDLPGPDPKAQHLPFSEAHLDGTNAACNDFPLPDFASQPLPFSTPGPGSLLSSAAETDTTVTRLAPVCSSPTIYASDSYTEKNSDHAEQPTADFYSNTDNFIEFQECYTDNTEDSDNSIPLSPHLECNPLFSNIFATPGPGYCPPLALHFDFPTEDPLSFNSSSSPGYQISYDDIDFQWRAFDLGKLTVPNMSNHAAFAFGASDREAVITTDDQMDIDNVRTKIFEMQRSQWPQTPVSLNLPLSSPVPPASPSPFRFVAPLETGTDRQPQNSSIAPGLQEQGQQSTTPKKSAFAPVPGIYISPLHPSPEQTQSSKSKEGSDQKALENKNTSEQMTLGTADNVRRGLPAAEIDTLDAREDSSQYSHASNDSIESWGPAGRCENAWDD